MAALELELVYQSLRYQHGFESYLTYDDTTLVFGARDSHPSPGSKWP